MKFLTAIFFLLPLILNAAEKPNIVLIYADDLGYGDVSANGAESVRTPNIDRLAREGLSFSSAYSTSSTCTPSRYSMLTGTYAFRKKGTGILPGDAKLIIDPGQPTLPSVLVEAGYRTGVVGKWHLGLGGEGGADWNQTIRPGPNEIGFHFSHIMAATGDRVPCVYVEDGKVVNLDPADPIFVSYRHAFPGLPTGVSHRDDLKLDWQQEHNNAVVNGISRIGHMKGGASALWKDEDMADHFTGRALDFIRRSKEQPFFLFFALHDIHVPRVPHPRFVGKTGMGSRGDAIVQADWQVGEVLKLLDELKLANNTLVLFTSDNGPVLNDGYKDGAVKLVGKHQPAGPFRGGKYSPFEGGTRMPMFARWPAVIKGGGKTDLLISQVDFPRSLARIAGREISRDLFSDSVDVSKVLLGKPEPARDHVVQQSASDQLSLRTADWKFIGAAKGGKGRPMLFDLSNDPAEKSNLASENPAKVRELQEKLDGISGL